MTHIKRNGAELKSGKGIDPKHWACTGEGTGIGLWLRLRIAKGLCSRFYIGEQTVT
jgi:hypothetical protein